MVEGTNTGINIIHLSTTSRFLACKFRKHMVSSYALLPSKQHQLPIPRANYQELESEPRSGTQIAPVHLYLAKGGRLD